MSSNLAQRIASLSPEQRALLERRRREQAAARPATGRIPKRQGDGPWPASTDQAALWFFHQLDPGTAAYNIGNGFRLRGALDVPLLERSLAAVIRRHEILRTTFQAIDGKPYQVIADHLDLAIPVTDLRHEEDPEATALEEVGRIIRLPFDLAKGPLLRLPLVRIGDEDWVLIGVLHHITTDWWSYNLFFTELFNTYQAFREGRGDPYPPLPVQFADYALWRDAWQTSEDFKRQESYWLRQLKGMPTVLEVPADRPRPAKQSFSGAREFFHLPRKITQGYKVLNREAQASPAMTLMAFSFVTLWRAAGRADLVMGQPVSADRGTPETSRLIGYLLNTLLFRVQLDENLPFRALLQQVRKAFLEGFENRDLPFRYLVEKLKPERDMSRMPLYQMEFLHVTTESPLLDDGISTSLPDLPDFDIEFFAIDRETSPVDMQFAFTEGPTDTGYLIEYNTDIFDPPTVQRVGHLVLTLMENILEAPDTPLREIPVVRPSERKQILGPWSRNTPPEPPPPWPLHGFFEAQARTTPEAVAVRGPQGGDQLTYGELLEASGHLANQLGARGLGAECIVGLAVERSPRLLVGLFGILRSGAAYLPLDPALPKSRLAFMMEDAALSALVTEPHLMATLPERSIPTLDPSGHPLTAKGREVTAQEFTPETPPVRPENAAYMIYTSGSTGRPKGVVVSHENAVGLVDWARRAFTPEELQTVLAATSLSFDVSLFEWMAPLATGGTVLLVNDLLALTEVPEDAHPTLISAVPSALLATLPPELPNSVRTICLAGEALPPHLPQKLYAHPQIQRVLNLYGPTEATVYALGWEVPGVAEAPPRPRQPVLIGQPIAATHAYILDHHLHPLPPGVPGELYLGGKGIARGYASRPALTAERFLSDPYATTPGARLYRTGDRARYLTNQGELQFLGRADNQIKLRGFRIELGEIENALSASETIQEAVVSLRKDPTGDPYLAAYIVSASPVDSAQLSATLAEHLPHYMIPSTFTPLENIPRLPSGKVDRKALPEPTPQESEEVAHAAPETRHEKLLAGIWQDVLGRSDVGIHHHFFDLGGHSLKATQVVARLRQKEGLDLPVRVVFEAPTIARLAAHLGALEAQRPEDWQPIPRQPRNAPLPLSFAQQRLWFLDQFESQGNTADLPSTAAYNMVAGLRLQGRLNTTALYRSFGEIVKRHETLRTTFAKVDGEPRQIISTEATPALMEADLSNLSVEEAEREVARHGRAEATHPFDLARGPLLRLRLLKLGDVEHVLILNLHHIVCDGWSIGILVQELSAFYEAYSQSALPQVPELAVQYADYAAWQRGWLRGEKLRAQIDFWRRQLEGAPKLLELPTDRPRPAFQDYSGGTLGWHLDAATSRGLEALSRRHEATTFMTLLAAFATLLARQARNPDIVLGTPVAGRDREEVEPLIGFFVNTVMMRTRLQEDPAFTDLLPQVRQTALDAFAHQDVPFERLVEDLAPDRNRSYSPLFQVLFILQNLPQSELRLPGLSLRPLEVDAPSAKYDLSFYLQEGEEGLAGHFEYSRALFDPTTILRLGRQYTHVLRALVAHPTTPVSQLPLVSDAERHQLLIDWNDTAATLSTRPIHEVIAQRAGTRGGDTAVSWEDPETAPLTHAPLTYAQVQNRALRLAHHLRQLGVGVEDRVAVCVERSPEMVAILLGIFHAGAAYVPLDPTHPPKRQAYMMADAQARLLIAGGPHRALGDEAEVPVLSFDSTHLPEVSANAPPLPPADAERLAYVLYTSGSTGAPKGVQIRHRALLHELENFAETPGMGRDDVVLALATLAFDIHTIELFLPLLLGARIVVASRETARDGARLRRLLEEGEITFVQATPATWQLLLAAGWQGPQVKALCGGEALTRELAEQILATGSELWNIYGPTETTVWSSRLRVGPEALVSPLISIGRPLDNMRFLILDRHLEPTPIGVPGELHIGGVGVDRGYLGRPRLTAEVFVPNPFHRANGGRLYKTGDLARFAVSGHIEFLGRRDFQVKIRGFRIELGEIEAVLLEHPSVARVAVVVHDDSSPQLVAWFVPESDSANPDSANPDSANPDSANPATLPQILRDTLLEALPAYMVPATFMRVEELPLNPNGKIDRGALSRTPPQEASPQNLPQSTAPRDDTELRLATIWQDVLERDNVGVEDDFFALGGHSLLAVRLMDRIHQETAQELPVATLFEHPTIAALARRLRQTTPETWSPLVPLHPHNRQQPPPLYFVHPAGGQVLCYHPLAKKLGSNQPFYGLQAQGLLPGQDPQTTVEAMAATYLQAIRRHQPKGPYFLGGYSLGGHIAYEMACRLREEGEEIPLLAIVDIYPEEAYTTPEATRPKDPADLYSQMLAADGIHLPAEELRDLPEEERLTRVLTAARKSGSVPPDIRPEEVRRYFRLFEANTWLTYRPGPYPGHLTVFHTEEHPGGPMETLLAAWEERVASCKAIPISGDHHSLLHPPHVDTLADALRNLLRRKP